MPADLVRAVRPGGWLLLEEADTVLQLVDVGADAYFPLSSPVTAVLEVATVEQIRERLLDAGLASSDEIEQHLENVRAGRLDVATPPLVGSWGRKSAA